VKKKKEGHCPFVWPFGEQKRNYFDNSALEVPRRQGFSLQRHLERQRRGSHQRSAVSIQLNSVRASRGALMHLPEEGPEQLFRTQRFCKRGFRLQQLGG
jgi:hypothetical protein